MQEPRMTGCGLPVPKTPGRKQKARISAKKSSSTAALPKQQTRLVSKGAKKHSSAKKNVTVQGERSSTTSEDREKENAVVQLKCAAKGTRAANKKVAFGVRVDAAAPKPSPPIQPLQSTRKTRAQAKALACAKKRSSAKKNVTVQGERLSTTSEDREKENAVMQLKCAAKGTRAANKKVAFGVRVDAAAPKPSPPIQPLQSTRKTRAQAKALACAKKRSSAKKNVTVQGERLSTTSEDREKENAVVQLKCAAKGTRAANKKVAFGVRVDAAAPKPSPPIQPLQSTRKTRAQAKALACAKKRSSAKKNVTVQGERLSTTSEDREKENAVMQLKCAAKGTRAANKKVAFGVRVDAAAPKPSPPIQAAGCFYEVSSAAESASDDEEWVESPTKPKCARLLPRTSRAGAHVKKLSSVLGSTKALGKNCPGHKLSAVRKISATRSSFSRFAPVTRKQVAPSKVARPFITSKARQGTLKGSTLEESTRKRHDSSGSSDMEQQRKQELLRIKIDAAKKDREQRLARAQAQRERREAERREQEQLRQREAQQKELERLKLRTAFHQLKQSERSLNIDTLAAATKSKAESPLVSASKKPTPLSISKPPKMARNACADAVAARLIFGQPSTSLSQKAKLNSLQQQAMPNSLPQSLRSQASFLPSPEEPQAASDSQSNTALVENTPEKACAALNVTVTLSSEHKPAAALKETFTVPSTDHLEASVTKTPSAANSTFVRTSGPPRSSGYEITPHRSELPPEPNKDKDNYDISDLNSGDEGDDYENPRKEVPAWAKGTALNKLVAQQHAKSISGLEIFGVMPEPNLDEIFPQKKKKYFKKRTSSQMWD
ncbi:inner centromere protein B-like isoform X1 [Dermacentor albipictus]|uniref:inner centromere protein B-like isoform X1 n=1 Tax=Dermacentor albipictus TaxID=60249 RepID=UPI0038FD1BE4